MGDITLASNFIVNKTGIKLHGKSIISHTMPLIDLDFSNPEKTFNRIKILIPFL
jgi:hypothetical protein